MVAKEVTTETIAAPEMKWIYLELQQLYEMMYIKQGMKAYLKIDL